MCTHYMGFSRLALIATICCNNCVRTLLCHQSKITRFYRYLRTDFNNFDQYIAQDKLNLSSYSVVLSPFTKYYTVFRLPSKRLLWTKYYWLFAYKWCFKFCSIGINKSEEFPAHRPPSCNQQRWSALGCKPIHALSLSIEQFLHNESSVCIHCTEYPFKVLSLKKIVTYILQVRIGFSPDRSGWLVCRRAGETWYLYCLSTW